MPNWCENNIVIVGKKEIVQPMVDVLTSSVDGETKFFDHFIPTPIEMLNESSPIRDEEKAKLFLEKYGAKDWYDWRVKNWGTKWDVGYVSDIQVQSGNDDVICLSFNCETAWAPPEDGLRKLSSMFPSTYFYCEFYEGGMSFQGYCSFANGEEIGSETVSAYMKHDYVIDDFQSFYEENKEGIEIV